LVHGLVLPIGPGRLLGLPLLVSWIVVALMLSFTVRLRSKRLSLVTSIVGVAVCSILALAHFLRERERIVPVMLLPAVPLVVGLAVLRLTLIPRRSSLR